MKETSDGQGVESMNEQSDALISPTKKRKVERGSEQKVEEGSKIELSQSQVEAKGQTIGDREIQEQKVDACLTSVKGWILTLARNYNDTSPLSKEDKSTIEKIFNFIYERMCYTMLYGTDIQKNSFKEYLMKAHANTNIGSHSHYYFLQLKSRRQNCEFKNSQAELSFRKTTHSVNSL